LFDDNTAPGDIGIKLEAFQGTLAGAFGVMVATQHHHDPHAGTGRRVL
jgi:hypothetical protein